MPDARLQRTRETLSAGYRFGDAGSIRLSLTLMDRWRLSDGLQRWRSWQENAAARLKEQASLEEPGYGAGV